MAGLGLSLTPLFCDEPSDQASIMSALTPIDVKTGGASFVHSLPSPVRSTVASPLAPRYSPVQSPGGSGNFTYSVPDQMAVLHARCRKAEQQQQEAQRRAALLEREAQELRAQLELARGDGKSQNIWKAATTVVGNSDILQKVRAQHAAWLSDARERFEEQHCTELWRLLRENLTPNAFSDVARSVGSGPMGVGKLLFEAVPNQQVALERRHSEFANFDTSRRHSIAEGPPKMPARAISRTSMVQKPAVATPQKTKVTSAVIRMASPGIRERMEKFEANRR